MSDDRLANVEQRLDRIDDRLVVMQTDISVLKTDVAGLKTDVTELKTDVAELKTDVAGLKTDVAGLKTDVAGLKTDVADGRRHMGVLHEDLLERMRTVLDEPFAILRQEMRAGFADVLQKLADHSVPGDAADRHFAMRLDDHERRIRTLEER